MATSDNAAGQIDAACRLAVAGKRAARRLAAWVHEFGVSETEFRMLWLLGQAVQSASNDGGEVDQAQLAQRLSASPAQVSGIVERLAASGLIECRRRANDRRRQYCRIAIGGQLLVSNVIARVGGGQAPIAPAKEVA